LSEKCCFRFIESNNLYKNAFIVFKHLRYIELAGLFARITWLLASLVMLLLVAAIGTMQQQVVSSASSSSSVGVFEDSWASKAPMPTARDGFGIAVVDGKIYAIGGYYNGYLNVNEMYDPVTNTWTTKAPMPTSRAYFAIAACQNKIYVIAGATGQYDVTYANEVYNPSTDTWEHKAQLPSQTERQHLSANVVNGKIYVIGGYASSYPWSPYPVSNETNVYDPLTDTWSTKAPIPQPTQQYASAVLDNKIYIIGGRGPKLSPLNLTQIYDAAADTWSYGTPMPTATHWCLGGATGLLAPKRIYIFGGYSSSWSDPKGIWSSVTQVYDPESKTWTNGALAPVEASFAKGGAAVINDLIYAMGSSVNKQYTPIGYFGPIDNTAPNIKVMSPENKTYDTENVSLSFTIDEPFSWIRYSLDAQDNVTIVGNLTLNGLLEGSHSMTVYATDEVGNTGGSGTIYFNIAKSEPFLTTLLIASIMTLAVVSVGLLVYILKRKR
jgi:N-acetylneuraminic acid mutarotase